MKEMNLKAKSFKMKSLYCRKKSENIFIDNLLNQNFISDAFNQIWFGDIT